MIDTRPPADGGRCADPGPPGLGRRRTAERRRQRKEHLCRLKDALRAKTFRQVAACGRATAQMTWQQRQKHEQHGAAHLQHLQTAERRQQQQQPSLAGEAETTPTIQVTTDLQPMLQNAMASMEIYPAPQAGPQPPAEPKSATETESSVMSTRQQVSPRQRGQQSRQQRQPQELAASQHVAPQQECRRQQSVVAINVRREAHGANGEGSHSKRMQAALSSGSVGDIVLHGNTHMLGEKRTTCEREVGRSASTKIRFFDEVFTSLVKLGAARRCVEYGKLMDRLRCERGGLDFALQEWCGLKVFEREGRRIRFSAAMAAIPEHW